MAVIELSDLIVMDGSASSILVGEDISVGDVICKPNIPGPALAYKANATADAGRYEVIGISVTSAPLRPVFLCPQGCCCKVRHYQQHRKRYHILAFNY